MIASLHDVSKNDQSKCLCVCASGLFVQTIGEQTTAEGEKMYL